MPADEFFDRSEFVQYFRDETDELLNSIDADLLRLEQFVDTGTIDAEIVNSLFRALHTIKGSAGMLDFAAVQQVAHKLENVYDLLRKDRMPLTESGVNLLFEGRDVLTALIRAAVSEAEAPGGVDEYVERLDAFAGVYDSTAQAIEGPRSEDDQENRSHAGRPGAGSAPSKRKSRACSRKRRRGASSQRWRTRRYRSKTFRRCKKPGRRTPYPRLT